jgi:hypothetical protein
MKINSETPGALFSFGFSVGRLQSRRRFSRFNRSGFFSLGRRRALSAKRFRVSPELERKFMHCSANRANYRFDHSPLAAGRLRSPRNGLLLSACADFAARHGEGISARDFFLIIARREKAYALRVRSLARANDLALFYYRGMIRSVRGAMRT